MADQSGAGPVKGKVGAKVAGQWTASTESRVNGCKEVIKKKWSLAEVEDAFPNSIKPLGLGETALQKLRIIATKVPNLPAAQALFLKEARRSDGTPVPFGFSHAARIVESFKANETPTPDGKAESSSAAKPTTKTASTTPNKTTKVPDAAAPRSSLKAPSAPEVVAPRSLKTPSASDVPAHCPSLKAPIASDAAATKSSLKATAQDVVAPGSSLKAPFAPVASAPRSSLKAPTAIMAAASKTPISKEATQIAEKSSSTPTMSKKRPAQKTPTEVEDANKKAQIDPHALNPKKLQHNTMAQPKPAKAILKRSNGDRIPSKISTDGMSMAAPTEEEKSPLSKIMAEQARKNEEFYARCEAREDTDTIRVAHPSDFSRSPSKYEHSKRASTPVDYKLRSPSPEVLSSKSYLKEDKIDLKAECLKVCDKVNRTLGLASLHDVAKPEERVLVDEVKRAVDKAVYGLKADIQYIFDTTKH